MYAMPAAMSGSVIRQPDRAGLTVPASRRRKCGMEWRDEGIILGARKHGETSAILEVMTRAHGRHLGLVRGGRSRKQQPVLQPGNRCR